MKSIFSILTLLFSCFTSCQQQAPSFKSVSVEEFAEVIANPEVQRLDVRRQEEFAEGHIPGSQLIDVLDEANFETKCLASLKADKPVALYCRSGRRSKKAAEILSKKGFKVIELSVGFNGWKEAGKEIEM